MTVELLIQCIVRQTTILIAQLATIGGARAPLSQVADQVFLHLVEELSRQGVGRKVSADMFGLGLRTYQRKIQRLTESATFRGQSLWEAVLKFIAQEKMATRSSVHERFLSDDPAQLRSLLRDLCESGLVFSSGHGMGTVYRVASDDELQALRQLRPRDGLAELVWAIIYHHGPLSSGKLAALTQVEVSELSPILAQLVETKRIEPLTDGGKTIYKTQSLFVPIGATAGWEAAVFDHFQAMVKTICCRLREDRTSASTQDKVGGSTFTIDVWPGHPLEREAYESLERLRAMFMDLRRRTDEYNAEHGIPEAHNQVVLYVGQCLIAQGQDDHD